mmetsp:Transcript_48402/g.125558  ORF Transcript_48402/g.125558 Transcript_48402/m.125558 type:complete len:254 (+) Transcript_48402:320-1081(+)
MEPTLSAEGIASKKASSARLCYYQKSAAFAGGTPRIGPGNLSFRHGFPYTRIPLQQCESCCLHFLNFFLLCTSGCYPQCDRCHLPSLFQLEPTPTLVCLHHAHFDFASAAREESPLHYLQAGMKVTKAGEEREEEKLDVIRKGRKGCICATAKRYDYFVHSFLHKYVTQVTISPQLLPFSASFLFILSSFFLPPTFSLFAPSHPIQRHRLHPLSLQMERRGQEGWPEVSTWLSLHRPPRTCSLYLSAGDQQRV